MFRGSKGLTCLRRGRKTKLSLVKLIIRIKGVGGKESTYCSLWVINICCADQDSIPCMCIWIWGQFCAQVFNEKISMETNITFDLSSVYTISCGCGPKVFTCSKHSSHKSTLVAQVLTSKDVTSARAVWTHKQHKQNVIKKGMRITFPEL